MFPCASFIALDYVFEKRNHLTVMMDLLSLPTPYIPYKDDHYPHSGTLAKVTYRKPWLRGKLISTCTLSTSVLDDLRVTEQHNFTEKFDDLGSNKGKMENRASYPAASAELLHQGEESKLPSLLEESFLKLTVQLDLGTKEKDLLLPEDIMAANFLPRFKHLPTLKRKVSRLKTLLVADPLICLNGDSVTEGAIFRHCAPYERSSDELHIEDITEVFTKESLTPNETLLLPELLDDCMMTVDSPRSFSSVCRSLSVVAEQQNEQHPGLEALCKDESASVDISHFSSVQTTGKGDWMKDAPPEWVTLPTEMELEVTLTPPRVATGHYHGRLSICDFEREELSPTDISLVSPGAQKQMGAALWKAEKYSNDVLRLLFAEPEVEEAAVVFQPLSEAWKSTPLESLTVETEIGELFGRIRESPESLSTEVPSHGDDCGVEDFSKAVPESDDCFHAISPPPEECKTAAVLVQNHTSSTEFSPKTLPLDTKQVKPSTSSDNKTANKSSVQVSPVPSPRKTDGNLRSQKMADQGGVLAAARRRPVQHVDPLTTFMMLRSQRASAPTAAPEEKQEKESFSEVQSTPQQIRKSDGKTTTASAAAAAITAAASGHASRGQITTAGQDAPNSRVVQVQATDSQRQAYRELLSLARPRLSSAKELGLQLPAWSDFERLAPDQTRYVLKQREMALCRRTEVEEGDEEQLFRRVLVIHMLVTAKELLFKCDVGAALEYLSKAAETCTDTDVIQLLRRLHIISHLGRRNHESDGKLLELQKLVAARLHNDKILVIMSLDCDDRTSTIAQSLKQLTAVSTVRPDNDKSKLNGASVVSSILDSGCMLVYEQHLGPDFPWDIFTLVVEYNHPGPSPWATVCKERRVQHVTFDTVLPGEDKEEREKSLEDKVTYVLLATESLLNCPLLLQMLESTFNIMLLERSHCPSLQMLGRTNHYSVITVDESTAIVVQEQDELCEERAYEAIAMRLTALSLQYNYCWIILHYPDGKGGGFSSEAFSNLVMVYSSLVLFGMKLEDLDVKVLIAMEVSEVARWVNRICFLSLMCSARDPVDYLERDWLAVTSSQEELCLSRFPCINPLVAQLMLRRVPSLPWLLGATLTQLAEMLPEVPHKVLKLFSNATSLYEAQPAQSRPVHPLPLPLPPPPPPASPLPPQPEEAIPDPAPFPSVNPSFLLAPDDTELSFYSQEEPAYFTHDPKWPAGSPELNHWSGADLWKDETAQEEVLISGKGRAGVAERGSGQLSQQGSRPLDALLGHFSPPSKSPLWRRSPTGSGSRAGGRLATNYGSRCCMGQERKRSEEAACLTRIAPTPLKKSRLSYEKVPGRTDGQTRLKLF